MLTAIAGGVGAARFLEGLVRTVEARSLTVVVNTGDDEEFWGLHVSPDVDSVTYMLADVSDRERGWGLADESFVTLESLERFGGPTWFQLGDRDLATHLARTSRLREGATLSETIAELSEAWGIGSRLLPMTDDRVRTQLVTSERPPRRLAMQEWFVRERSEPPVSDVLFEGASEAAPAPGVIRAITEADAVVICPSNPLISVGPILAVPGILSALTSRRDHVVAISPIVGGKAVKGPADDLMASLGMEVSCVGIARAYQDFCGALVIDTIDEALAEGVEACGVHPIVCDTMMRSPEVAARLSRVALDAVA